MASNAGHAYRRSRHLAVYWKNGGLICHNYRTKSALRITLDAMAVLDALHTPRTLEALESELDATRLPVREIVAALTLAGFLEPSSDGKESLSEAEDSWTTWEPFAAAYHFSTRDGIYAGHPAWTDPYDGTRTRAPLQKFSRFSGARRSLPQETDLGVLTACLEARRTWRKFGAPLLSQEALATVLRLTFGVRSWHPEAPDRIAFRTSPSGGARHPIEAFVCVQQVDGLEPGLYHYSAVDHDLTLLKGDVTPDDVSRYLVRQQHFVNAHAYIFMSAVFARTVWKYRSPRAYRAILIEAGHLAQTFCLAATALDLASFTTMAFHESAIEDDLGLDGVSQSVMYVTGVGSKPADGQLR